jgi:hypothetical protein
VLLAVGRGVYCPAMAFAGVVYEELVYEAGGFVSTRCELAVHEVSYES